MYYINTDLIAFLRNVITMMTGNPVYPDSNPTLPVMAASVDKLEVSVHAALDGGKMAIATRNENRIETLGLARQLAAYVEGHCGNNLVNLLSSGFEPVKAPGPSQLPLIPGNQRVEQTDSSGQLLFKFDRVQYAVNYSIQSAESADGPWQDRGLSTTSRVTIDDLTPGKVYWVRACANGAQGSSDFGGPATAMSL